MTRSEKFSTLAFSVGIAGMCLIVLLALVGLLTAGCVTRPPVVTPIPPSVPAPEFRAGTVFAPFSVEEWDHLAAWTPLYRVEADQAQTAIDKGVGPLLLAVAESDASVDALVPWLPRAWGIELGNEPNFGQDAQSINGWYRRTIARLRAGGYTGRIITAGVGNIDDDTLRWLATSIEGLPPDIIIGWHAYSGWQGQIPALLRVLNGRPHAMTEWGLPQTPETEQASAEAARVDLAAIRASGALTGLWYQTHDDPRPGQLRYGLHAYDGHWRPVEAVLSGLPPTPPTSAQRQVVVSVRGAGELLSATGTLWDDYGHTVTCSLTADPRVICTPTANMSQGHGWHLGVEAPGWVYEQKDFVSCVESVPECYPLQSLPEWYLSPVAPPNPPIGPKSDFWTQYQGNFGTMKLAGCGLHLNSVFDPFLLERWLNNRPCYEQMMQLHASRGDNRIVVDPRAGYGGHNDADLWHDPAKFREFLLDVRSHVNINGENFKVLVFLQADEHIQDMRSETSYTHWKADIDALAAVTQDVVDATATCWECRHQQDFTSSKRYIDTGRYISQRWPLAVHAQHLRLESSSWSSWPCNPDIGGPSCVPSNDADDPNKGNETAAWTNCRAEGWCDLFLFQGAWRGEYLYPESYPLDATTGQRAWASRWWEIVVRLGDDPQSLATSRAQGDHHGWPQVPLILFELGIYDTYWMTDPKATEQLAIERCKEGMALGGWGCGSGSWRQP